MTKATTQFWGPATTWREQSSRIQPHHDEHTIDPRCFACTAALGDCNGGEGAGPCPIATEKRERDKRAQAKRRALRLIHVFWTGGSEQ